MILPVQRENLCHNCSHGRGRRGCRGWSSCRMPLTEVNMMTRSGKKNDCPEVAEDGEGATAAAVGKGGVNPADRLDELTDLVKSIM